MRLYALNVLKSRFAPFGHPLSSDAGLYYDWAPADIIGRQASVLPIVPRHCICKLAALQLFQKHWGVAAWDLRALNEARDMICFTPLHGVVDGDYFTYECPSDINCEFRSCTMIRYCVC